MSKVYELHGVDMRMVGGPMHMQREDTYFRKYFTSVDDAKKYAEKHYKKNKGNRELSWTRVGKSKHTSGDLGWVMYRIKPVEITVVEDDGEY